MADPPSNPASQPRSGPDPLLGRVINDRFRVVSVIARGGMGKVYRAEQAPLGRAVALKVLNPNYQGDHDPEFHKRFFLEASICAKLTHPNTVTIFDYGRTEDDVYYIAMELLEGRTLHRALREEGPFPPERAMHIARQVCRSLREAHGLGVIHRDLKPANVFLVRHGDETDFVKVLDFGLVKDLADKGDDLTQTGLFMGSPKYMSPEQIRGDRVDPRCDVYSLGVIMYEMLTGKVPFDRPNSVNILMAHVHEAVPPMAEINPAIEVPPILEQIVLRAMAKDTGVRFASMDELLAALKDAASQSGLPVSYGGDASMSGEFSAVHSSYPPGHSGGDATGSHPPVGVATPSAIVTGSPSALRSRTTSSSRIPVAAEPPVRTARGAGPWLAASLVAAAVLGAAVLAIAWPDAPPPTTPTPTTAPTPPTPTPAIAPTPSPPTPAAPTHRIVIALRSEPSGVLVEVGDRSFGPTPIDVEWTGDDAAPGREVVFRFHREGFGDETVTRSLTGERLEVSASLSPVGATKIKVRPPRPRRDGTEAPGPVGPLKGYKTDPY